MYTKTKEKCGKQVRVICMIKSAGVRLDYEYDATLVGDKLLVIGDMGLAHWYDKNRFLILK